jgi:hypothetical protein
VQVLPEAAEEYGTEIAEKPAYEAGDEIDPDTLAEGDTGQVPDDAFDRAVDAADPDSRR